jgi:hypothetical protein
MYDIFRGGAAERAVFGRDESAVAVINDTALDR